MVRASGGAFPARPAMASCACARAKTASAGHGTLAASTRAALEVPSPYRPRPTASPQSIEVPSPPRPRPSASPQSMRRLRTNTSPRAAPSARAAPCASCPRAASCGSAASAATAAICAACESGLGRAAAGKRSAWRSAGALAGAAAAACTPRRPSPRLAARRFRAGRAPAPRSAARASRPPQGRHAGRAPEGAPRLGRRPTRGSVRAQSRLCSQVLECEKVGGPVRFRELSY
jgi:hypothetical protein